ncbi:MAG: pyridoxal phosphate-dependent aminotransferase [Gemmatimonadetes bacterium]|nr:pyridoxal phosphate-dependent aminotransferase [Gemmatimonadota bacterium]
MKPSATLAVSALAKRLEAQGRDIINLSTGEPDFDTPGWISDAAMQGIRDGRTRYTPTPGLPELRAAIARFLSRGDRVVDPAGIVVSSGAKQALFNACFSLFGPGDEVIVATPYWTSYPEMVGLARATSVFAAGSEENDFRLSPEDLERVATPATKGLLFSSPCNPTGVVYGADELRAVAEWARDRGIWLISDEIYRHIYFGEGGEAPGLLDLPATSVGPHVLINGASKSFAMTGWRVGFSATTPELAKTMQGVQSHITSNAATPSQMAALAAYSDVGRTREDVARMREAFRRRRDLVMRLFDERLPNLSYLRPEGAFYLFFRVDSAFGDGRDSASAVCSWLLEEVGVAVVPGEAFGEPRYARMSFATSDAVLDDAIRRMATLLG